jgi:hypothetical protein
MADARDLIAAARNADWMQVVLNGGPPCFHLSDDGPGCPARFCLRAERWQGHGVMHSYTPLHELVARAAGVRVDGASAGGSAEGIPVVLRQHHPNCAYAALPDQPTNCSCPPRGVQEGS